MKKGIIGILMVVFMLALTGCGSKNNASGGDTQDKNVKEVSLEEIQTSVKEAYGEDYIPSVDYDKSTIEEQFGVKEAWYDDIIAQGPMISTHVDTFIAVKAKPENKEDVKTALGAYRDSLIKDTMQYPINQIKIQASRVESYGNYVFFLMLGVIPTDAEEQKEDIVLKAFEEQNQKSVDAIESTILSK